MKSKSFFARVIELQRGLESSLPEELKYSAHLAMLFNKILARQEPFLNISGHQEQLKEFFGFTTILVNWFKELPQPHSGSGPEDDFFSKLIVNFKDFSSPASPRGIFDQLFLAALSFDVNIEIKRDSAVSKIKCDFLVELSRAHIQRLCAEGSSFASFEKALSLATLYADMSVSDGTFCSMSRIMDKWLTEPLITDRTTTNFAFFDRIPRSDESSSAAFIARYTDIFTPLTTFLPRILQAHEISKQLFARMDSKEGTEDSVTKTLYEGCFNSFFNQLKGALSNTPAAEATATKLLFYTPCLAKLLKQDLGAYRVSVLSLCVENKQFLHTIYPLLPHALAVDSVTIQNINAQEQISGVNQYTPTILFLEPLKNNIERLVKRGSPTTLRKAIILIELYDLILSSADQSPQGRLAIIQAWQRTAWPLFPSKETMQYSKLLLEGWHLSEPKALSCVQRLERQCEMDSVRAPEHISVGNRELISALYNYLSSDDLPTDDFCIAQAKAAINLRALLIAKGDSEALTNIIDTWRSSVHQITGRPDGESNSALIEPSKWSRMFTPAKSKISDIISDALKKATSPQDGIPLQQVTPR